MSGRLVAAIRMTLVSVPKPSISTRIWLSVCLRSSCEPPVIPSRDSATDSVDFVDKDDTGVVAFALFKEVAHTAGTHTDEHLDKF